ncbi:purine-binding chemotaxis protein CheW [Sphingomonas sp. OV641]|uniref:chemotaxis protein CheW n=1 Tax=unclassified Sphingomonas TaxID=196159 RepID=UPI000833B20D|nr:MULTISPECIES: chemotaxis protein CheW [unclassified Sphingomonas]SEJ22791.1 purine-binding chemotaxis protein CheW [Sphingomonas sp. OV641]
MTDTLHLLAHVGGRAIAVPADAVDSVVDISVIIDAPRAHPAVRGLTALRSRVVTVIDTWRLLDLPPPADDARRAIITVVDGHHHAVLVDTLEDVAPLEVEAVPPGLSLGHRWAEVTTGSAERGGEPLLVIDIARLIGTIVAAG